MDVSFTPVRGNELYQRYPGQTAPQACYIALDCRRYTLWASFQKEVGSEAPGVVLEGNLLSWPIPILRGAAVTELLRNIQPLAQRVCVGHWMHWDNTKMRYVAYYDQDAQAARQQITDLCKLVETDWSECVSPEDLQAQ